MSDAEQNAARRAWLAWGIVVLVAALAILAWAVMGLRGLLLFGAYAIIGVSTRFVLSLVFKWK